MVITSLASGRLVNMIGYYTPFLLIASIMMSIGSGLLTTLKGSTTTSAWIGYQILFGFGAGSGIHQTLLALQSSFHKPRDIVTGTAIITFAQTLGAAVAIGMAQSAFENKLVGGIGVAGIEDISAQFLLHTGATNLRTVLTTENLDTVLRLYTHAVDQAFCVSVGLATVSVLGALAMEWRPVRGSKAPIVFC
jgi:hypothetical protein